MATGTLTGQTIANTYKALLKITGTTAGGETLHATTQNVIEDGDGNPFPLSAAQDALMITSTNRLEFGTNANYVYQVGSNVLGLVAGTEIDLTATTIDINGTADISGAVGLASSSGVTTIGSSNGLTVSAAGVLTVNSATDSTSKTTGSTIIDGGVGIAKTLHVGTGIVEEGGVLKENLLTNSGFDVWSNSTLEVTSTLTTDDAADDGSGDWAVSGAGFVIAHVSASPSYYTLTSSVFGRYCYWNNTSAQDDVAGKLYRIEVDLKMASGTAGAVLRYYDGSGTVTSPDFTVTDSWVTYKFIIESNGSVSQLGFRNSTGSSVVYHMKDFTFTEVTPGITNPTGNCLCFDGWSAGTSHSGLNFFRQENIDVGHASNKTNSKLGSFYALKIQFTRDSSVFSGAVWPGPLQHTTAGSGSVDPVHLEKFRGKTVTLGCWVKSSTTGKGGIAIDDADTVTTVYTTGTSWEWLEVTDTIGDTSVSFDIHLLSSPVADGSYITYFSQPMLVFGSSIGEGNYTRPQGEIVYLEDFSNYMNSFNGNSFSDTSGTTINLEAESDGQIPKGVQAVQWYVITRDSADTSALYFEIGGRYYGGAGNDVLKYARTPFVACDSNGDASYSINASGSSTTDVYLAPMAVQLR